MDELLDVFRGRLTVGREAKGVEGVEDTEEVNVVEMCICAGGRSFFGTFRSRGAAAPRPRKERSQERSRPSLALGWVACAESGP